MATSAAPPKLVSEWGESNLKDSDKHNLIPDSIISDSLNFGGSYNSESSSSHRQFQMTMDSGDSVQSHNSATNRGPPPGLTTVVSGHKKNSSATTAQLTLTPASSVDGSSTADNVFQNSNSSSGPSMPTLPHHGNEHNNNNANSELPKGITTFGGFGNEAEDDGLLGLHALRERSYSSPGPVYSSSPTSTKGTVGTGSFQDDSGARAMAANMNGRPRAVSKDNGRGSNRPPLSGATGSSSNQVESLSSSFQGAMSFNTNRNFSEYATHEQNQPSSSSSSAGDKSGMIGTIGRYGSNLGREFAESSYSHQHGSAERHHSLDHTVPNSISNKFGSLPSLGSQLNQRGPASSGGTFDSSSHGQGMHGVQRHQRSMSQPGPVHGGSMYDQYGYGNTSDDFMYQQPTLIRRSSEYGTGSSSSGRYDQDYGMQGDGRYSNRGEHPQQSHGRSMSLTHAPFSSSNTMGGQRRSSHQNNGQYGSQNHPSLQRRDVHEFVPGQTHYDGQRPSSISPSQSPMQVSYGRSSGDIASSSPMSMGSSAMRGHQGYGHDPYVSTGRSGRSGSNISDEELSHPLIGEHIEVPGDDHGYMGQSHGRSHPRSSSFDHHYTGETSHPPTAGAGMSMPKNVYNVKFKRTQRSFVIGPRLNRDLKIGTYVKVEADRGEDLGIVIGRVSPDKLATAGRAGYRGGLSDTGIMPPTAGANPPASTDLKRIIRLATHDEVSLLAMKREEEEELLQVCRTKVRQRTLPMHVVDAEYQFDRHKLTFFFEAEGRIDFRELVRDLFSMYKTRIWMQQLDKNTSIPVPVEGPPAPVQMDYGTPIIAPASEFEEFAALNDQVGEINAD